MSAYFVLVLRIIVILCLYLTIGVVISTLWKNTFGNQKLTKKISWIEIGYGPPNEEKSYQSSAPEFFIGRDEDAEINFTDDTISNIHTRLFQKQGKWWIDDMGSTNGTLLNNTRLSAPDELAIGDNIQCGNTIFRVIKIFR